MDVQIFLAILILPISNACNLIRNSPLECRDTKKILRYHNERRNDVAQGKTKLVEAKNMWRLKWDDDLSEKAANHAELCDCSYNKQRPQNVGQNHALRSLSKKGIADLLKMVVGWYEEIYNYQTPTVRNGSTNFFTQMIWGSTKYVGCGMSFYEDNENDSANPFKTLLICYYRPSEYEPDKSQKPYTKYDGMGRCDNRLVNNVFNGLCDHDEEHWKGCYRPCKLLKRETEAEAHKGNGAVTAISSNIILTLALYCTIILNHWIFK